MRTIRTTVAVVGTSVLLGGVASPALAQESTAGSYPSDWATQTVKGKKGKKRGHRRLTDAQLTTVATALGTDLATLKTAMSEVKAAARATEERETKAEMDAALAEKLGVTAEQVRAAFASVRTARPARPAAASEGAEGGRGCKGVGGSGSYPTDGTGSYPTDGTYPTDTTATTSTRRR